LNQGEKGIKNFFKKDLAKWNKGFTFAARKNGKFIERLRRIFELRSF